MLLTVNSLYKRYGKVQALSDVNLQIDSGKIIGLLGPNGSGKTTLIKIISGLSTKTSGEVLIDGTAPGVNTKKIISYLPERTYLEDYMKISDAINFFCDFYSDFDKDVALKMLSDLDINEKMEFREMSKGTKEKVQLILVMSRKAKLYLLDEPIGGVDPAARDYILSTIINNYNKEASVVISTHLIADVEKVLDEVIFIAKSKIILQDTVDNIRTQHNNSVDGYFREVFKC